MTVNPVATVFDNPLLQDAISLHLLARDLQRCVCVSRGWCSIFKPYILRVIVINSRTAATKLKSISIQDLIIQYAHKIQVIDCRIFEWPFPDNLHMKNLTVLKAPYSRSKSVSMLKSLQKLRDLELRPIGSSSDCLPSMLSAIASHTHLRSIKFAYASSLKSQELRWILWSFARLESITLSLAYYDHDSAATGATIQNLDRILAAAPSYPSVKDLDLQSVVLKFDHTVLTSFLIKCRHLKRISLPLVIRRSTTLDYSAIFTAAKARIQHLDAQRASLSGSDMAVMIQACVGLRWFRCAREQHNIQGVVDALIRHSKTLEDVDLTDIGTDDSTGAMLQLLLCSCPHLRSFIAMMPLNKYHPNLDRHADAALCPSDMVMPDGRQSLDWACLNLTKLAIRFMPNVDVLLNQNTTNDVEPGSAKHTAIIPRILVEQLKRLFKLEDLRLGCLSRVDIQRNADAVDSDQWRTDNAGLMVYELQTISEAVANLATLGCMKRLELRNLRSFMDHDAIQAMRTTHWHDMEWCQYS